MGGSILPAPIRGCRAGHTILTVAIASAALALPFTGRADAQPAATPLVTTGHGLTAPAGVVSTPDGAHWVSDELLGVCRVTAAGPVASEFCAPPPVEPPAPPLPEGAPEPPPPPSTRPTGTGQIAFDAATANFFVAEGTSGGSGVWRLHWNAGTGAIDAARKIFDSTATDDRVVGLALTADGDVVFSSKRSADLRLLRSPAFIAATPSRPEVVGRTSAAGTGTSLAVVGRALYVADDGRLAKVAALDGSTAAIVPGQPAGATILSLAADPRRDVVFAGTANADLADAVLSVSGDVFARAAYDSGYTNITGLGVGPDGALYVAHDPNGALSPGVVTSGLAELYRKDAGPLDPPIVALTRTPKALSNADAVAFSFASTNATPDTRVECTLDDAVVDCPVTAPGTGGYTGPAGAPLAEGLHRFAVRATNVAAPADRDWGRSDVWVFGIDRTPPVVTIDPAAPDTAVGGRLRLGFVADGPGVAFSCQVDDRPAAACSPPKDFALAPGEHTITIRATDAAQNTSAPVTWKVTAVAAPAEPAAPAPAPVTDAPAEAATTAAVAAPAIRVAAEARAPRIAIGVPCVAVSPARAAARFRLGAAAAIVRFRAPAEARYAKVTLRRTGAGRGGASVVETLGYPRIGRAGAAHRTRLALTRDQRRLLRRHRVGLAIAYGTCRTQLGRWEWMRPGELGEASR